MTSPSETTESLLDELERLQREYADFAYRVSHDLQAPLRSVVGFSRFLESSALEKLNDKERQDLAVITQSARQAQRLIEALLHYSRIVGAPLSRQPVDSGAVVAAVWAELGRTKADEATIDEDALPTIMADPMLLARLFRALLENALQFRMPGRPLHIRLHAERAAEGWVFTVADNGLGIAAKYHQRVFELFCTLRGPVPGQETGLGSGLAIARKIVERHGGKLWLESEEGAGTSFHFFLPFREMER